MTVPVIAGSVPAVRPVTVLVTAGSVPAVRLVTVLVIAGSVLATTVAAAAGTVSATEPPMADGGSLSELQEVMGHADPRTTRRYDRERQPPSRSPGDLLAAYLSTPPRKRF